MIADLNNFEITTYATTDSQTGNLTVGVQTYMACTWSDVALNVSFGESLNPGTDDYNATENYNCTIALNGSCYNVTVSSLSTANADVLISGMDLVYSANTLKIGNVTYQANTTFANGSNMVPTGSTAITGTPTAIFSNEPINSSAWYRLWIDLPASTVAGTYVGNYTLTCQQVA